MKRWQAMLLKIFVGYFINTLVVSLLVLLLHFQFKLDVYDAVLICSAGILLYSFLTVKEFERSLPATSPLGGDSPGIGDPAAHAAILNTVVADFENRNRTPEVDKTNSETRSWLKYLVFRRSKLELISYAVILVGIGLIKYYAYF